MNQPTLQENAHQSNPEVDSENININEDEEDWQDAEEEHQASSSEDLPTSAITNHTNHTVHTTTPASGSTAATTSTNTPKEVEQKAPIDETELRKKIKEIQLNKDLTAREKAKQIQYLMSHGTTQPPSNNNESKDPADNGRSKSYHDEEKGIYGCKHYQRKCKLQANCCQKIVTCRFCHDDVEDHNIVRSETKNMLCMLCMTLQPAAQSCRECGEELARYYCDKCKLWDNDPRKSIYHCDDCGICRQGKGLGEDFFHCKKCNICLNISMKSHKCIERNLESDCPICGEYMFTSTSTVIFMPCGHCIHKHCYTAYIQTSYQCPTCLKSLGDMSEYFNRLDKDLERQPMPAEYEKFISHIFCNDCERKTPAKYHFFYHKCGHCGSFNTTVLKTENTEETAKNGGATSSSSTTVPIPPTPATAENGSSIVAAAAATIAATAASENHTAASSNSDQDHIMQQQQQQQQASGSSISLLGVNGRNVPPPPPSSSSSSASRSRNGAESNEG